MEFDFDPAEVSAVGAVANDNLFQAMMIIGLVAVAGFFGRLIFVSFGSRLKDANPLREASGGGMILAAIAIIGGMIVLTGKQTKAAVLFERHIIDPVIVSVLKKDSCRIESGDYCVVVFDDDREIIVNWHDYRVSMFELLTPTMNPPWGSIRPNARPDGAVLTISAAQSGVLEN